VEINKLINLNDTSIGDEMYSLIRRMYPICRSITGNGVRETLAILQEIVPITINEVPTGTQVFDWTVPKEWNIEDAYIKNSKGEKIVEFARSNLHVVNYSIPVHKKLSLQELKERCYSLPEQPSWIPYRTSYYNETWGFCLAHDQLLNLDADEYEVFIDSTLKSGALTYGEYYIKGATSEEILVYTHTCHPSLCNDNLSGLAVVSYLAGLLRKQNLKYSYRFVFGPGTIGSITWLSCNEDNLARIKHGLVVALVGDSGDFTYKKSRQDNTVINRAVLTALRDSGKKFNILDFSPYGYDERQFCSPGINLSLGRLTRTPNGEYKEYHTSADNLEFVKPENLYESLQVCIDAINILENNETYINLSPKCEPQLGKRGLYSKTGGGKGIGSSEFAKLWVLNLSDGEHSLLDIAERSKLGFRDLYLAAIELSEAGLLCSVND